MGDAVLGFYLPIHLDDNNHDDKNALDRATSVQAALTAATKLVTDAQLGELFANFRAGYRDLYETNFGIGVGVTCGRAKFGNIGAAARKEYTLIGQPVNQVARVQGCARAGEVVCTGESRMELAAADHAYAKADVSISHKEAKQRLKGFEEIAVLRVTRKTP